MAPSATISVLSEVRRTGAGVALQIEHAHHEIEFNLVIAGRGTYFLADGQHDLVPGTLVWLLPGQMHRLIRSPDLDMWVVTLQPDALDPDMLEAVARRPCRTLSTPDAVALDRLLTHISQDVDEPQLYEAGLVYAMRSAWSATVGGAGPAPKPMHPAVMQALSILRSSAETPTSTKLAKRCGVAQDYLGQLLMEHTGRGFVEWRNRTRLERFHILYPESGDLLTAALDAGFGSYSQFHRVFSDMIGVTPGEWAKSGAQPSAVALPSSSGDITGSAGESMRMVSYALCNVVFPTAATWFHAGFASNFRLSPLPLAHVEKIESGLDSDCDVRMLERKLIEALRTADSASADRLENLARRRDLFDLFRMAAGRYPTFFLADVANLIGLYLCYAYSVALYRPTPGLELIKTFSECTRHALVIGTNLARATTEERQLLAVAFTLKIMILRNAHVASRASGNDALVTKVADAAQAAALATTGIDVRAIDPDLLAGVPPALAS